MSDQDGLRAQKDETQAWSRALALFQEGYELQSQGLWADAMARYRESIQLCPTAEAHTFLGWVYSFLGLYGEAIAECKRAIEVDPSFGNPYNDIGAFLMELGRDDEAVSWFRKALVAERYDARCYPLYNLGRIFEKMGDWPRALEYYCLALRENPTYDLARTAWMALQARLN
ncbi:MAG: tetratricopeptide repeat protein [Chloroflexota bacterium]|nr:tetratricopeptide repeat protein [Chloroflexota bacterium]